MIGCEGDGNRLRMHVPPARSSAISSARISDSYLLAKPHTSDQPFREGLPYCTTHCSPVNIERVWRGGDGSRQESYILEHLVVAAVRAEAARVVLVQDLHLVTA